MESDCYTRLESKTLSDEALKLYNDNLHLTKKVKLYYNLYYCDAIHHPKNTWLKHGEDENVEVMSQYFLKYTPGAFARAHSDDNNKVVKTAITLIDKSDDLEGGDIIVYEPHYKSDMEVNENTINRYDPNNYREGDTTCPVIVKQSVGETIEYAYNVKHSVSKVLKGYRTVLVTWYCKRGQASTVHWERNVEKK